MSDNKIRVLDAEVVKRIAAGETLQRPVNAVKELLENSLDAGADRISIQIQVPQGKSSDPSSSLGLFSISVTDNGCGIGRDDLGLLCERHATSKLRSVADLSGVGTYGFRGEALASCSQVGRVEVVTRRADSEVAWRAAYLNGRLTGDPIPIAGNPGTTIHVKDLFYGNRVRREALQASSEEYAKIFQVVQAYALNYAGRCSFQLSKRRDRVDLQSGLGDDVIRVIKTGWGEDVGGAVLPFEIEVDAGLGIEGGSRGWATRTTFHRLKSAQVIIFLNGRLIEHAALRRALLQAFSQHLPTSPPAYPFIYVDLRLQGTRVDVNVHPSKRQVVFLDEGEIVARVVGSVDEAVLRRQYETQPLNPIIISKENYDSFGDRDESGSACYTSKRTKECNESRVSSESKSSISNLRTTSSNAVPRLSALYPSQRVLTDHRNHRIDTFLFHSSQLTAAKEWSPLDKPKKKSASVADGGDAGEESFLVSKGEVDAADKSILLDQTSFSESETKPIERGSLTLDESVNNMDSSFDTSRIITEETGLDGHSLESTCSTENTINDLNDLNNLNNLNNPNDLNSLNSHDKVDDSNNSINLNDDVQFAGNPQMSTLLRRSVVVGLIDSRWCLLQSGTNLMLCDMEVLSRDLFYSLLRIGKCGGGDDFQVMEVDYGVKEAFEAESDGGEAEGILKGLKDSFKSLLKIQFECDVSRGLVLKSLPAVLAGQRCPGRSHLQTFIQRLCLVPDYTKPDWQDLVLRELAALYSLIDIEGMEDWEGYVRHVVLPAYRDQRARYYETRGLKIITNTETLYRSFERC